MDANRGNKPGARRPGGVVGEKRDEARKEY
jgi:hypothetical protein